MALVVIVQLLMIWISVDLQNDRSMGNIPLIQQNVLHFHLIHCGGSESTVLSEIYMRFHVIYRAHNWMSFWVRRMGSGHWQSIPRWIIQKEEHSDGKMNAPSTLPNICQCFCGELDIFHGNVTHSGNFIRNLTNLMFVGNILWKFFDVNYFSSQKLDGKFNQSWFIFSASTICS